MKIYSDDGKVFNSVEECNAYESDLALKKQKEEAARRAEEEKQNKLAQFRVKRLQEINIKAKELSDIINDYQKECKQSLYYTINENNQLEIKETLFLEDAFSEIFKIVRVYN